MLSHKKIAHINENKIPGSGWTNKRRLSDICDCIDCKENLVKDATAKILEQFTKFI